MKYLGFVFLALMFSSCIKDKLENDALILEGTWNWHHSIEYSYDAVNDTIISTIIPASNYSDSYGIRFEEKGRVYAIKNSDEEKYRLILPDFKSGLCNELNNSYQYKILLNNNESDSLVGCVNADTLITSDFHLPLSRGATPLPYYQHVFIK
jgi:hypothetical protein